jgi:predicted lipoprotein with Yx(FWY)xxD motif
MFIRFATKSRGALLLALLLFAGACGSSAANTATPTTSTRVDNAAISSASNNEFGTILTDRNGMTLYFFDNDKPIKPQSSCTGKCATAWPIVPATDGTTAGTGVDAAKVGQTTRADGQAQLTYNNWPLYTFSGDSAAGETNGQGIMGIWHVAGLDGKPITAAVTQPPAPADSGY